ncbi:MAG: nucleoside hydrolase [Terracidiphilus sp.]|nr:nucleoside hydrolase [Terracidiphilus sp.]
MKMRRMFLWSAALVCAAALQAQTAQPWQIGPFTRPASGNPVITPRPESILIDPVLKAPAHWEALHTFNPAAIVRQGKVVVLYRAEDDSGAMAIGGHTSRLGLAESTDGIHFTRRAEPVFFPAEDGEKAREWPGGVEDPRIVESESGTYVLTYTQWNRTTYSVGIATSPDLTHWTKHGPAFFTAAGGKYAKFQYKSAGIVTRLDKAKGRLIAAKIDGKYWMYWGEGSIRLATSPDLIHWTPVEDAQGAPIELLKPRDGHFDSSFPETGPPPVATEAGIVMLYNGKNAPNAGDPEMGANAYAAGEALFDAANPAHLIAQTARPVLKPELPYEKTGQYVAGTTFAEGLVVFQGQWFLYYGCADSKVAVATAPLTVAAGQSAQQPQLAILDTDIGDDIDDAFALALALRSPELRLLGITTAYGDTELRARLVDRYLDEVGEETPVAAGVPTPHSNVFTQAAYARQGFRYSVTDPAKEWKHLDGVSFLLDQIRAHPGQITLIAIGPLNNVQAAIERDPATFRQLKRVVMMGGSVYRGYDGSKGERRPADAEWNINRDPAGARALLAAGVPVFMMPLDSTQIHLETAQRERIFSTGSPLTDQLTLLYHQWMAGSEGHPLAPTLYDPVAVAYAIRPELCPATPLRLEVDDKGFTRPVEGTANAQVCLQSDEGQFMNFLLGRIVD